MGIMESRTGASFRAQRTFTQSDFDRFAALSGDDNPIHVDPLFSRRTKFGRTVAHGMLLYAVISSCVNKYFADSYQAAQELIFPNPTYAGEELDILLKVADADPARGTTTVESQITREDGTLTCQSLTCIAPLPYKPATDSEAISTASSQAQTLKGLKLGQRAVTQRTFSAHDLSAYCDLIGEESLLYRQQGFAQENGFKDTPIPGALLGGMFSYLLGTRLPGRGTNWLKQKLYFLEPVYPDQEIIASAEIVRLRPAKDLVNLQTTAENSLGVPLCWGEALVLVKDLEW
jgi:acyl dehydratase